MEMITMWEDEEEITVQEMNDALISRGYRNKLGD